MTRHCPNLHKTLTEELAGHPIRVEDFIDLEELQKVLDGLSIMADPIEIGRND